MAEKNTGDESCEDINSRTSLEEKEENPLEEPHLIPKRQRDTSPSQHSFEASPNYNMVPPSPPKYVTLSEVMKTARGIGNMALAHTIAVDGNFKIEKRDPDPNSVTKKVSDVMKQAFWHVLQEKLDEDPPDFSNALVLLDEVKEELIGLLLPQHQNLKNHIEEVLDLELIEQQADHGTLDFMKYADFIVSIMGKLCAPIRDENIEKLAEIKDIVPLYREMFEVLELMKIDMANFTLQQARPLIQQHAVEYEQEKFKAFIKQQEEHNVDGLQDTKEWLFASVATLQKICETTASRETPAAAASSKLILTATAVINHAYMQLLIWPANKPFPETVLIDQERICFLQDQLEKLIVICGVLLITYNTVGASIAGVHSLKLTLKDHLMTLLQDVKPRDFEETMPSIAEQVVKDVQQCLCDHGFTKLKDDKVDLLKGQVIAVQKSDHAVFKLIRSRILGLFSQIINTQSAQRIQLPPGVSAVSSELQSLCGNFLRLISHNRAVFTEIYQDIVSSVLDTANSHNDNTN